MRLGAKYPTMASAESPGVAVFRLEISYRGLVTLGLALLTLWAIVQVWGVLLLVIVAFIFMAALLPYVEWLCRHGFPRVLSALLVLLAGLLLTAGLISLVVPAMIDEFSDLRTELPHDAQQLEDFLARFNIDVELSDRAEDINWGEVISGRAAVDYGQRVILGIVSAITVLVVTAYLLVDAPKLKTYLYRFVPRDREEDAEEILHALGRVVGGYIRGQAITSAVIGLFTIAVLLIADVPNALAFGVLAAFADVIPLVGAFIAIVPPAFAAFQESPTQALIVLVALLLYQQFEDRFLAPRVYGSTLGLPPLTVLLAVLVGGELLGIPGILLALPAAAAGKVGLDYVLNARGRQSVFAPEKEDVEVAAPDDPPGPNPGPTPAAGSTETS